MDERIERLNQIAQQGNIDAFYSLIREDVSLLENMDKLPFVDTPLHKAASAGHTRFAMEMMRLKPSFARKLNPDGFSPMHLALQNDQTQMVLRLLEVDGDLACIQGREGVTPLHHAVETGDLYLVAKFLSVCPNSIKDVTIRSETALHIALKTDQSGAFELLVGWLRRSWFKNALLWEKRVVNWEDEEGNTALHVAASKNQPQAVKQLLNCSIDVNAKNLVGYTALDILQQQTEGDYKEIKDMLCRAGALNASSLPPVTTLAEYLQSTVLIQEKLPLFYLRERTKISSDMRNVLLVVAVLLVTVTYQAALSPPGGVWQDDYNPDTNDHQFNTTALGIIINEVSPSSPHNAGTVVMGLDFFRILLFFNSATFYLTIMIIGVLLPIGFTGGMFFLPLGLLFLCYIISMSIISPSPISTILILFFCYVVLFLPVSFGSWGKRRRKLVQVFLPVVRLLDPTFT